MLEKLNFVLNSLKNGDYRLTLHAQQRMAERRIAHADIRWCGTTGIITSNDEKFKVVGRDLDNIKLTIICVDEDGVLIITVF